MNTEKLIEQFLEIRDASATDAEKAAVERCVAATLAHGPRDEATVKTEALREAAQAQRQLAAEARTKYGRAEHDDYADWLDQQANDLDPARLEGAHP